MHTFLVTAGIIVAIVVLVVVVGMVMFLSDPKNYR